MSKRRTDDVAAVEYVAPPPDKFTPDEHARRQGNMITGSKVGAMKAPVCHCWQHSAAANLHGWGSHAHHAGEPIKMTEADYLAALKAASVHPYVPHPGALSPHCRKHGG